MWRAAGALLFALLAAGASVPVAAATQSEWRLRALARAGLTEDALAQYEDLSTPEREQTMRAIYAYYATVFAIRPAQFQWAGLAKLAGAKVLLATKVTQLAATVTQRSSKAPLMSESVRGLVRMNRAVFEDLAWQHEAYLSGGMDELHQLQQHGDLAAEVVQAWALIDSANPEEVRAGTRAMLRYEQARILQPIYDAFPRTSAALMSAFALSPVPGGAHFHEVVPNGSIDRFEHRLKWIELDVLPVWAAKTVDEQLALTALDLDALAGITHEPEQRWRDGQLIWRSERMLHAAMAQAQATPTLAETLTVLELQSLSDDAEIPSASMAASQNPTQPAAPHERTLLFFCGGGTATPAACERDLQAMLNQMNSDAERYGSPVRWRGELIFPSMGPAGRTSRSALALAVRVFRRVAEKVNAALRRPGLDESEAPLTADHVFTIWTYFGDAQAASEVLRAAFAERTFDPSSVDVVVSSLGYRLFQRVAPTIRALGIHEFGLFVCIHCATRLPMGNVASQPLDLNGLRSRYYVNFVPLSESAASPFGSVLLEGLKPASASQYRFQGREAYRPIFEQTVTLMRSDASGTSFEFLLPGVSYDGGHGVLQDKSSGRHAAAVQFGLSLMPLMAPAVMDSGADQVERRLLQQLYFRVLAAADLCAIGAANDDCNALRDIVDTKRAIPPAVRVLRIQRPAQSIDAASWERKVHVESYGVANATRIVLFGTGSDADTLHRLLRERFAARGETIEIVRIAGELSDQDAEATARALQTYVAVGLVEPPDDVAHAGDKDRDCGDGDDDASDDDCGPLTDHSDSCVGPHCDQHGGGSGTDGGDGRDRRGGGPWSRGGGSPGPEDGPGSGPGPGGAFRSPSVRHADVPYIHFDGHEPGGVVVRYDDVIDGFFARRANDVH